MRKVLVCLVLICAVLSLVSVSGASTVTVLYTFTGSNGANPVADLVQDSGGNIWGTTENGGTGSCPNGCGTIFELTKASGFTSPGYLYSFQGGSGDGAYPASGLIFDKKVGPAGTLFGTTSAGGGSGCGGSGCGTIFSFPVGGSNDTVLYSFAGGSDGATPLAELLLATSDKKVLLYGTTSAGGGSGCGGSGCGTVFAFQLGDAADTVLYRFTGGGDGANPVAALVFDSSGKNPNLWGTAENGGVGYGTIFELTASSGYTELVVGYSFMGVDELDGATPEAALTFDSTADLLYGTTAYGGDAPSCSLPAGCGTVFQLQLPQSPSSYSNFYSFTGLGAGSSGAVPTARLALETKHNAEEGYVYGTASQGGIDSGSCPAEGCGTAFAICPPTVCDSGAEEYTLFSFDFTHGANPAAGMLLNLPKLGDRGHERDFSPPGGKGDCTSNCSGSASSGGSDPSGVIYVLTD